MDWKSLTFSHLQLYFIYADVNGGFIIQLSFYFNNINAIRTVLPYHVTRQKQYCQNLQAYVTT